MMVKPIVVKITGEVSDARGCLVTDGSVYYPFEIIAPFKEGDNDPPDKLRAAMEFSACVLDCATAESCTKSFEIGIPQCPSERAPGQFRNHFGGTPGYISVDEANANVDKIRNGGG